MQTPQLIVPFFKQRAEKIDVATTYYRLLSAYFNLSLSDKQIQVLAHIAINNGIASGGTRKKFVETYNTSRASLDNIISRLKKRKILGNLNNGREDVVALHPKWVLDFNTVDSFKFEFSCDLK